MNIKILLPALAAAFLLSACGSIVPKPQTDLFTIAKFESDNTIVGQIANPEKQIVAYYDAEHRENAKPAKGGNYHMHLERPAARRAARTSSGAQPTEWARSRRPGARCGVQSGGARGRRT